VSEECFRRPSMICTTSTRRLPSGRCARRGRWGNLAAGPPSRYSERQRRMMLRTRRSRCDRPFARGATVSVITTLHAVVLVALMVSSSSADDLEARAMAQVRLSTEITAAEGCMRIGSVKDNSVRDLRRKIVRAGGDTGILSFGTDDQIRAEVFRCPPPFVTPLPSVEPFPGSTPRSPTAPPPRPGDPVPSPTPR
jgi:hypothetical protein